MLSTLLPFEFTSPSLFTLAALFELSPGERSHQLHALRPDPPVIEKPAGQAQTACYPN